MQQRDHYHLRIEFGFGIGMDRDGFLISRDEAGQALSSIKSMAARLFNAYTLITTFGGWINGSGRLVEEDGYTLFVVVPSASMMEDDQWDATMGTFANFIKSQLNQETVAVGVSPVRFGLL